MAFQHSSYNVSEQEEKQLILLSYKSLLKSLERKKKSKEGLLKVKKAFQIAANAHITMRRNSGEPYIMHPIAVARIVVDEMGLGVTSVVAALLHDTVEDTDVSIEQIESEFGKEISFFVAGLTKIRKISDIHKSSQAENIKKILVSLIEDPRVILIKIADRLHNIRTLDSMSLEKKIKIAGETKQIYIPIAHRLGLYNIKNELDDLCMQFLESSAYNEIKIKLKESLDERETYIRECIEPIKKELKQHLGASFLIEGRSKSISSIWRKMQNQNVKFEQIFDLFAIRIIVNCDVKDEKELCWQVYSIISSKYKTIPSRFRDWLVNPKANGYEALHMTILGHNANWIEVQIRSRRMNEIAEKGVAAHFLYKEKNDVIDVFDNWFLQIRDLIQNDSFDTIDIVTSFQNQIYEENIYVLTPQGEVKILPANSTVLDFAFSVHSDIGQKCLGAKVNYKLEPLSKTLKSGDKVEIITSEKITIEEKWLTFVKTNKAINKIKTYFKLRRKELVNAGTKILNIHLNDLGFELDDVILYHLTKHFHSNSKDDFLTQLANYEIDLLKIDKNLLTLLLENYKEEKEFDYFINDQNFEYKFSSCCNPIHGDQVFGLLIPKINQNKINIHQIACNEAEKIISKYECKIVQIKWNEHEKIKFLTTIKLAGFDEVGIIYQLTSIISKALNINISAFNIEANDGTFKGVIKVFVENKKELDSLISELKSLKCIEEVLRII